MDTDKKKSGSTTDAMPNGGVSDECGIDRSVNVSDKSPKNDDDALEGIVTRVVDEKLSIWNNNICNSLTTVIKSIQGITPSNLDNCREVIQTPQEADNTPMAYDRIRVNIGNDANGKPVYTKISGNTQDERNDNIVRAYIESGRIFEFLPKSFSPSNRMSEATSVPAEHGFREYAENWYTVFAKPNIEASTAKSYREQLDRHWIPAFGDKPVESIIVEDIQNVLTNMGDVAKDTRKKALTVIKMILDRAVDDGFVSRNVSRSTSIKIAGRKAKETPPYSVEQMRYLVSHIPDIKNPMDRAYLALSALHPLRPEEVFGLQHRDVNRDTCRITIERAVTHPDRNQPLLKCTKTDESDRVIDLVPQILQYLPDGDPDDFIVGGKNPLSYQQARRMRNRIKKDIGFDDDIVPRRFRTTVLTDIYDVTKDIKSTQHAGGHATPVMTLKHYAKGREENSDTATPVADRYGLTG